MYMDAKQKFILILVPILFVGTWITLAIVNAIQNPAPYQTPDDVIYQQQCIKIGGIPQTRTTADEWRCEKP